MERASRSEGAFGNGVFEPFDLTLSVGPGLVPWISAASRLGHVHGIPRRRDVRPLDELLDAVYDFVDAVHFAERDPKPFLTRELGELVFGEPSVLELFHATRGAAADRGREVLVRILASPHLSVLPWELLPDPGAAAGQARGRDALPRARARRLRRPPRARPHLSGPRRAARAAAQPAGRVVQPHLARPRRRLAGLRHL